MNNLPMTQGRVCAGAIELPPGAALTIAPAMLALRAELGVLATAPRGIPQLLEGAFTNLQVPAASLTALGVSVFGLWRSKMTGFAWTTATLAAASYVSLLLPFNWLDQKPEIMALWCLPREGVCLRALRSAEALSHRGGRAFASRAGGRLLSAGQDGIHLQVFTASFGSRHG